MLTCFPVTKTTQFRLVGLNDDRTRKSGPTEKVGREDRPIEPPSWIRAANRTRKRKSNHFFSKFKFKFKNYYKYLVILRS